MAFTTQMNNVEAMSALTGLTHDIFIGHVVNNVRRESKTAMLFQDAQPGEYRLEGQNMKFAIDLRFKTGAMATDGKIPDYVGLDAVQGSITPIRRYARIAIDNLVEKRASGPGAFDNLSDRIFDKLWDAWASMEARQAIGATTGVVCKAGTRTSSTVFTVQNGYNHTGTNPIQHLSEGSIIGWYDTSGAAVGGAAKISSINYSTNQITVDSGATWEPSAQLQDNVDLIYFASSNNIANDNFTLEKDLAPNGIGTILDPNAAIASAFTIAESTYPRWKPYRKASATFDHMELTEFWLQMGTKRGFPVTPETDACVAHPASVAQLARSLMGLQQQAYTGTTLSGGYSNVTVAGMAITQDPFFYHDVCATLCREKLYRVPLGGDADFWGEDGSMWSRIANFDGKDAFVVDYLNFFSNHRGAHGALTGIVTPDITDADFDAVPNY